MGTEIRFCRTAEGARVAYRVHGDGPPVVVAAWWFNHLDVLWESAPARDFFEGLARRFSVVLYDKPGCGLSDREPPAITLDAQVETIEALADHLSLRRFALFAHSAGGPPAIAYAVRHPERVTHLALFATKARTPPPADPERQAAVWEASKALMRVDWGLGSSVLVQSVPNREPDYYAWLAKYIRESVEADTAIAMMEDYRGTDVRELAEALRVPTVVLHRRDDPAMPFDRGRELASCIPGAQFVPLEGSMHALYEGDVGDVLAHTVAFFVGAPGAGPVESRELLEGPSDRVARQPGTATTQGLTPRERQVVALIAAGKTNAEIAKALTIAPATASRHVQNILTRLGMRRRSEVAAFAAREGLTD